MLTSLAIIFLLGMCFSYIATRFKIPGLVGMMIAGMIISPYALNLLSDSMLSIAADLRQLALIIILSRAGLSLHLEDLKKVGRPAILMCFIPACFEIAATTLIAPFLLPISFMEAALIGTVIAAVSPAVIVPRMLKLMEEGYGKKHSIPQMILAGASVDDVFVIVLFTACSALAAGNTISIYTLFEIPCAILLGIALGCMSGILLCKYFKSFHLRDSLKVLILLSISFLFIELENRLKGNVPISGLLAIMSMGITIRSLYPILADRLCIRFNKLWVPAEIILFVLVGTSVNLSYALKAGIATAVLILISLGIRMLGVFLCLLKTNISKKERLFTMIAYCPKATVQAAIGGVPLAMGLACGQQVLTAAVISILLTAPLGALCIDHFYPILLKQE